MDGSRTSPRYAVVAAVVAGLGVFLVLALTTGQPALGLAAATPMVTLTFVVWRRGGLGYKLRNRILAKVPPAKHRPFRKPPWDDDRWDL